MKMVTSYVKKNIDISNMTIFIDIYMIISIIFIFIKMERDMNKVFGMNKSALQAMFGITPKQAREERIARLAKKRAEAPRPSKTIAMASPASTGRPVFIAANYAW